MSAPYDAPDRARGPPLRVVCDPDAKRRRHVLPLDEPPLPMAAKLRRHVLPLTEPPVPMAATTAKRAARAAGAPRPAAEAARVPAPRVAPCLNAARKITTPGGPPVARGHAGYRIPKRIPPPAPPPSVPLLLLEAFKRLCEGRDDADVRHALAARGVHL